MQFGPMMGIAILIVAAILSVQVYGLVEIKDGVTTYTRMIEDIDFDRFPLKLYLVEKGFYYVLCSSTFAVQKSSCNVTVETATEDGFKSKSCQVEFESTNPLFKDYVYFRIHLSPLSADDLLIWANFYGPHFTANETNTNAMVLNMPSCRSSKQVSTSAGYMRYLKVKNSTAFDLIYFEGSEQGSGNFYRETYDEKANLILAPEYYKMDLHQFTSSIDDPPEQTIMLLDRKYDKTFVQKIGVGKIHLYSVDENGKPEDIKDALYNDWAFHTGCDLVSVCFIKNHGDVSCSRYDHRGYTQFNESVGVFVNDQDQNHFATGLSVINDCRDKHLYVITGLVHHQHAGLVLNDVSVYDLDSNGRRIRDKPPVNFPSLDLTHPEYVLDGCARDNFVDGFNWGGYTSSPNDDRAFQVHVVDDQACFKYIDQDTYVARQGGFRRKIYFTMKCFSV